MFIPEVYSDHAIRKVASPPKPLNKATISGIEVIFTFKAISEPTIAPRPIPAIRIKGFVTFIKVTRTATSIARADKKLPLTAVSSLPSILMPDMKRIDEII